MSGIRLWAVLTAVILTQLSVGRSLRATIDYFIGTVGAAVYAGAAGAVLATTNEVSLAAGPQRLEITPVLPIRGALLDLRAVELRPAGRTDRE